MSYLDETNRNRPKTIAAVAILHVGLGYLIVSGLAYTVITHLPTVTTAENYKDAPPPPPRDMPPPPPRTTRADPPPAANDTLVRTPAQDIPTISLGSLDPPKVPAIDQGPPQPPPPPKPNLTRSAEPGTGRSGWVTSDDYPPQPLREGVTGVVGISVAIAADGHVQGCQVTKSSGNAQLDEATCRIYARRARFKPALDADGKPATATFADRIRWQLPAE